MVDFILPSGYTRIKIVSGFEELVSTRLDNGVNALCWPRALEGNFDEIAHKLAGREEITPVDDEILQDLRLSAAGRVAANILLEDRKRLEDLGLAPQLDCISAYPRDEDGPVPTDVYSFHADRAPIETYTYLCSYNQSSSEGLQNEQAVRRVDVKETRAELQKLFGGGEGAGFDEFLAENCFDLHYAALPGAKPFSFGIGNLWRIAVACPGSPVPPCIHRAPDPLRGAPPRLLLIS